MSKNYLQLVPVPPPDSINSGLAPCHQATMLALFGRPGRLTNDCSEITNPSLKVQIVTRQFRYIRVTGWEPAVNDLHDILAEVDANEPELYPLVGTAGMLCNRRVRTLAGHPLSLNWSNHSWGTPFDATIGGILSPQGARWIPAGLLALYPYFHKRGWWWMAEASPSDPMHFEPSDQRIRELFKARNGDRYWGNG